VDDERPKLDYATPQRWRLRLPAEVILVPAGLAVLTLIYWLVAGVFR
jgi:hypothetical protein